MGLDWCYVASGGFLAGALSVVLASAFRLRRLKRRLSEQEALLRSLERDMQALCAGAKGMGVVVAKMEQRLYRLTERQDNLDLRDPNSQLYHHAIALVRRGAGVQELVNSCGIAASEAELIHLLHKEVPRAVPGGSLLGSRSV